MSAPAAASEERLDTLVIRPPSGWASLGLGALWRFRELLFFLTWRDVKVRYKQTVLGASWALIQPLVTMIVFTFVFHRLGGIEAGVPYPAFSIASLALWFYFANSINMTSNSLVANAALITKVYFPRLALAISPLLAGLVDFAIAIGLTAVVIAYYGVTPSLAVLLLPVIVLLALASALGAGLLFSALNVRYRDVRYAVPFLMQILLFASPVGYPADAVEGKWQTVYGLNPLTGILESFRWALLGTSAPSLPMMVVSIGSALTLLLAGLVYFARTERSFADVI